MPLRNKLFAVRIRDAAADAAFCQKARVPSKGQKISHANLPLPSFGARNVENTGARKCRVPSLDPGRQPDSADKLSPQLLH
jgi:hypothetical protein